MATIKIVVNGATGRMGTETMTAICRQDDLELVGAACHRERGASLDRKSTRLNSSHIQKSRMPSSA